MDEEAVGDKCIHVPANKHLQHFLCIQTKGDEPVEEDGK